MDEKNQRLLDLLQANAREATSSLARKLNLSRTAVHERIAKLEAEGVIRGYTVRLDKEYEKKRISAQVMIEINPKLNKQVETALRRIDEVRSLYTINGQYDFIALIRAETTEQIDEVLDHIGEIEGIEKTMSSIVLSTKFER
ncbi:AsnC family transcriptional regulator [Hahella sp. KA22]|uniref:Lrp/AsnC family transcriptional regulator n=1 Tax=unclassified Hahella TaxID=2624107 RepID=UPI000FDF5042|nr:MULTISPECIES: Lrp/AsnC family transcriptional regulator [unclassified Hahella]AZZ93922.1 Lrp/AsnC family transcriptional regulator [Hahella sp. KA22]QAY57296.1 AsnC family transcriptional regulator [Hahella sp. KA22]WLQ11772.1 Lrp/AsnC family transcriptional regulator [Hahella sp. HNIBRBA332]